VRELVAADLELGPAAKSALRRAAATLSSL
jgi:hypothetical protein